MERLAILGLVLTISGAVLSVGFWPLASVSGAELLAAQSTGQYGVGSRVFIREKVLDLTYVNIFTRSCMADLPKPRPSFYAPRAAAAHGRAGRGPARTCQAGSRA